MWGCFLTAEIQKNDMNVVTLQVNEVKIDISLSIVALLCAAMFPIKNRFTINYFCVRFNICFTSTQLKFTCSKSTIEALEKGVKYVKFLHLSLVLLLLTLYMLAGLEPVKLLKYVLYLDHFESVRKIRS